MYPELFSIGPLVISSFGAMMALGFLAGGWLAARAFPSQGLQGDLAWSLVGWAAVGGIVGSKLWFAVEVIARDPTALDQLLVVGGPLLSRGGITWYGGLLGGALAVIGAAHFYRLDVGAVANAAAPSLAVGQALGRVGCFLVGDDWGLPTDLPWGIAFPRGVEPTDVPVHPTQLYEVVWLGAAALLLWRRREVSPSPIGEYLVLAGLGRFGIEFARRNPALLGALTNAQVTALICIALGAGLWLWRRSARRRELSPEGRERRAAPEPGR